MNGDDDDEHITTTNDNNNRMDVDNTNTSEITTQYEEDTLLILEDLSRVASPPVSPLSARETPSYRVAHNANIDIQGIPWHLSLRLTRAEYRLQRSLEYALLEQRRDPQIYTGPDLVLPGRESSTPLYAFTHLNRTYPATAQHFQLRHLVDSPTASSVFFTFGNLVVEWDPARGTETVHLNFRERVGPHTRITALCATEALIVVGGFYGELVVMPAVGVREGEAIGTGANNTNPNINHESAILRRLTNEENGITNHIKAFKEGDPHRFLISSNDSIVRIFDAESDTITELFRAETAVNAAAISPHGRMLCLATDSPLVDIVDMRSGQRALQLDGHLAFTFSCDWSPDGRWLCTGNEDHTARIYDVRSTNRAALYVVGARMAPIRNVRFSPDGLALAVMEETDFVTIYDTHQAPAFNHCTTIDFFGEASGISFTPDSERLYVGCGEASAGGIFEFVRHSRGILSLWEDFYL